MKARVSTSHEELESVSCVACMPNGSGEFFSDDVRTACARCGVGIHHRPGVPTRPPKLCLQCAMNGPEDGTSEDWQRYLREVARPVYHRAESLSKIQKRTSF